MAPRPWESEGIVCSYPDMIGRKERKSARTSSVQRSLHHPCRPYASNVSQSLKVAHVSSVPKRKSVRDSLD